MPSGARVKTKTVARRRSSADAPARCRSAGFQRGGRPQQEKRKAAIAGREMQLLAQFQIELVDHPGDGGWRARTQRLGKSPQGLFAVRRFDQDETRRIKAESVEAMAANAAMWAPRVARHHQDDRISARQARQNRHDEAEGGGNGAFAVGHDFMQRAGSEAAMRQAGIKRGKPEWQGLA